MKLGMHVTRLRRHAIRRRTTVMMVDGRQIERHAVWHEAERARRERERIVDEAG
jgi:hypothetical protein